MLSIYKVYTVHIVYYSSVLLHSLFCHPSIPPSLEYHYIGGANAEVRGTTWYIHDCTILYYYYYYIIYSATRSNSALHIGQPLIPGRTPYSTLFLRGYTKVDHMYCNILIPMYSGSVQISNSERQYTVHTLYIDNVEITTAVFLQ